LGPRKGLRVLVVFGDVAGEGSNAARERNTAKRDREKMGL